MYSVYYLFMFSIINNSCEATFRSLFAPRELLSPRQTQKTFGPPVQPGWNVENVMNYITTDEQQEMTSEKLKQPVFYYGQKLSIEQRRQRDDSWMNFMEKPIMLEGDHVDFRYEILKPLGQGSCGEVVEVVDHKNSGGPTLALKIMYGKYAEEFAQNEIDNLSRLKDVATRLRKNIHVIKLLDSGKTAGGHPYIVTPIYRYNLEAYIDQFARAKAIIPMSEVQSFAKQILTAMSAMKMANIVHADLKPDNILMDENKQLYVIDFGFSRELKDNDNLKNNVHGLGTYPYMAPDLFLGYGMSFQMDVWSFGMILTQLLTRSRVVRIAPSGNLEDYFRNIMTAIGLPPKDILSRASTPEFQQAYDSLKVRVITLMKYLDQILEYNAGKYVNEHERYQLAAAEIHKMIQWNPTVRINVQQMEKENFFLDK